MLERLTVRNLAVIEGAEASFAPGLTVLTGETGAGKSVLMGALELVLGARAEAGIVRDGAVEAEVEAVFTDCTIRRTVTRDGRSRAWIDDESVTLGELRERLHGKVDIHGPRANQRLLDEDFQLMALDAFAGLSGSKASADYASAWKGYRQAEDELKSLASGQALADEIEMLRFQIAELDEAGPTDDDADLAERHAAAAHAGEIVEAANAITEGLGGEGSALRILASLRPRFAQVARHLPEAGNWSAEADDIALRIEELSRSVADALSRVDVDPDAFAALDARLGLIRRLERRYGNDLTGVLARKKARLDELENIDVLRAQAERKLASARAGLERAGAVLSSRRASAAKRLASAVTRELVDLGFLQAKFSVELVPAEPDSRGFDRARYLFEPNPGEPARSLAVIASSGEIARVMLAMKSVLAAHDTTELLVFDEIDANIGGEVGRIVGEKMRAVARSHQVIAITHLPQSAVYGEHHLVVSKHVAGGRTRAGIVEVEGENRVNEIARMLGGEKLTSVTRRHAEELLNYGKEKI